ncbi:hypothetical protein FGG08_000460 [Glutinoglossum americanum]|uniref:Uncharacterized protein n=1 Tax=Glutinoglossum americanum TaxID=1670608 RepID=A0A9P8L625_9PEZI|nr:hypothetical protein FGG08_000460 [Glutinoglossum americanum]
MEGCRYTAEDLEADFARYIDYPNPGESASNIFTGQNGNAPTPGNRVDIDEGHAEHTPDFTDFHLMEVDNSEFAKVVEPTISQELGGHDLTLCNSLRAPTRQNPEPKHVVIPFTEYAARAPPVPLPPPPTPDAILPSRDGDVPQKISRADNWLDSHFLRPRLLWQQQDIPGPVGTSDESTIQDIDLSTPPIRAYIGQQKPEVALIPPVSKSQQKSKTKRCCECRFAHTKEVCDGGSPCQRCKRLFEKLQCQLKKSPQQWPPMSDVVFFDIGQLLDLGINIEINFILVETQGLLVALREEADAITGLYPRRLEDIFNGRMRCHFDNAASPGPYSPSSTPVIIKRLATTRAANATVTSEDPFVRPALDASQMDGFVDSQIYDIPVNSSSLADRGVIKVALRLAAYIAILFNWNQNTIYTEYAGLLPSKNLALETVYSIAYRVQELAKKLGDEVHSSLNHADSTSDPAAISCSLWIVYRSLNNFKSIKWNAKSLRNLQSFLNGLHERAPAALTALQRYKTVAAYAKCGQESQNMRAFDSLINAQASPKAVMSFAYEEHKEIILPWSTYNSYEVGRSYADVLEAQDAVPSDTSGRFSKDLLGLDPWTDRCKNMENIRPPSHKQSPGIQTESAPGLTRGETPSSTTPDTPKCHLAQSFVRSSSGSGDLDFFAQSIWSNE